MSAIFFTLLILFVLVFIWQNIAKEKKDIQIRETISKIESQQRIDNIRLKTNKPIDFPNIHPIDRANLEKNR